MGKHKRLLLALGVVAAIAVLLATAASLRTHHAAPAGAEASVELLVDSGADRGPGTLREALYSADSADRRANISIRAARIVLETPLPPLVNPRGIRISAPAAGVEIDARALAPGPVLDVDAGGSSLSGLKLRNCGGSALLVRASRFQASALDIEACDVGIDVAENSSELSIERSRFANNRIGIRIASSSANSVVAGSHFSGHADAAVWAVRAALQADGASALSIHDNVIEGGRLGIVAGNIALAIERNTITNARETALHLVGSGVTVRANRISGGASMGVVAEATHGVVIDNNEIDNLAAYAIMVRNSGKALLQRNRIHNCGFGIAFVLGDPREPSTAVENVIVAETYNGVDVVGDSPILRRNRVVDVRGLALRVDDFRGPDGAVVASHPYLAENTFGPVAVTAASK